MKIISVFVCQVEIPLRIKFSQSNNSTWSSSSTIVGLKTQNGITGYGETCPRTYVTGETPQSVIQSLKGLKEQLVSQTFRNFSDLTDFLDEVSLTLKPAALCGLELALLDAWGKEEKQSVFSLLNANPDHVVKYSGVVPAGNTKHYQSVLGQLQAFDFEEIKLKVGTDMGDNVEKLRLIKKAFGPEIGLRVDVNTAWTLEDAKKQIPVLSAEGVNTFEQMFPKGMEKEMGTITQAFGKEVRIMADESITTLEETQSLIDNGHCNHFNLKISKNGGIRQAFKIAQMIHENGLTCQLGAHFGETSILSAAGLIFSSIYQRLTANEGGLGIYLLKEDITEKSIVFNREAKINPRQLKEAPGVGVVVVESLVNRYAVFKRQL